MLSMLLTPFSTRLINLPTITLLLLLASLTNTHVILKAPKPCIFPAYGPSNPLDPSGSDFPCKMPPGVTTLAIDGSPTTMAIGEPQTASFTGLAVHGGGSCQFSLLPGFEPSKSNADFRVIKSIEGGCPAAVPGNLESGDPDTFLFTIPASVEPGNYTFAWNWVSRITNEVYMNCAPITVTAPPQRRSRVERLKQRALQNLPPLFIANLADVTGTCKTDGVQQLAIAYPEPGSDVDQPEGPDNLIEQTCNGNPYAGVAPVPQTTMPPTVAPTSYVVVPAAGPSSSAVVCAEGNLLCVDGNSFSTCTGGQWVNNQPLAPGTQCIVGSGSGLNMVVPLS